MQVNQVSPVGPFGYKNFSRTSTIHPGIFLGRALWADCDSPRMNTISSRDQFKAIKIGENFAVNYNIGELKQPRRWHNFQ